MTTSLRPFQQDLKDDIFSAWQAGARNVCAVMPTGAGKTVSFTDIMAGYSGYSIAIAHRQEIVTQISLALARNGLRHRVIGPASVAHACTQLHLLELNRNYINPSSNIAVAGVDTLIRMPADTPWFKQVGLVVQDECHHLLRKNKWGIAHGLFPNAKGLGVTATPVRSDGQGLGVLNDGVFNIMVEGPTMRELIDQGWLTDYRIFAPPSDLDLSAVPMSASGDFSPPKLAIAVHKSHIVGDVVQHYLRIASGKLGVTFAVDVLSATEIAKAYRDAGVPAEVVSANTPSMLRAQILRRFKNREILQLVNVDLFGEGFDLPAIEVVSMARPTQSFALYCQQFGRCLRLMEGKNYAIIIDHVGNVHRHGLPDAPRIWSLDRREKRASNKPVDIIPVRTCPECSACYERVHKLCPYCKHEPAIVGRGSPQEVDGDLSELSFATLARLRGLVDEPIKLPFSAKPEVIGSLKKHYKAKQEAQAALREHMALWGGARTAAGDSLSMAQRRFYLTYNIDVLSAQALNKQDAITLMERIKL